eukprot:1521383-Prymnesium_polylepis.1
MSSSSLVLASAAGAAIALCASELLRRLLVSAPISEAVGDWTKPQMKGFLTKEAVQSKSNSKKRYFVLMGNFLMYYEDPKDSGFHPKGVWCLEDCRKGFMKRPGLNERQAVLLRGKRELVITADSLEELEEWNRAVQVQGDGAQLPGAAEIVQGDGAQLPGAAEIVRGRARQAALALGLDARRARGDALKAARGARGARQDAAGDGQRAHRQRGADGA